MVKTLLKSVVLTRYNNKTYIVDDIDFTMNPLSTFRLTKADREISFIDYYRDDSLYSQVAQYPRIINIYYTQRIAQNAIEKTAIFAPKIWCLQAGNSKMVTYFTFLQPLKLYLEKIWVFISLKIKFCIF